MYDKCFGTEGITDVTFLDTVLRVVSSWRVCAQLIKEICFNGVDIGSVVLTIFFQVITFVALYRWVGKLDDNESSIIRWMMRRIDKGLFCFTNWIILAFVVGKTFRDDSDEFPF